MDIGEIRYRHARRLIAALAGNEGEAGGLSEFAVKVNKSQSQVSQFAGKNPIKGIGNKIAREIEKAFGLKHGEIDRPLPEWDGVVEGAPLSESRALLLDACEGLDGRAIVKLIQAAGWLRAGMDISPVNSPGNDNPALHPAKTVQDVAKRAYQQQVAEDLRANSDHYVGERRREPKDRRVIESPDSK